MTTHEPESRHPGVRLPGKFRAVAYTCQARVLHVEAVREARTADGDSGIRSCKGRDLPQMGLEFRVVE